MPDWKINYQLENVFNEGLVENRNTGVTEFIRDTAMCIHIFLYILQQQNETRTVLQDQPPKRIHM